MRESLVLVISVLLLVACGSQVVRGPASIKRAARKVASPTPIPTFPILRGALSPFVLMQKPIPVESQSIGGYSAGCIGGAIALPKSGPGYEVQRLSRKRFYGHPELVSTIQRAGEFFAAKTRLFIGDLGMPAGGPAIGGHASHQTGLDVDIWFRDMRPEQKFTEKMRENMSASVLVSRNWREMKPKAWKAIYGEELMWFAAQPEVSRVFVNAVIKKKLCADYKDDPRLLKIRPWGFHHEHFHVRMNCPLGSPLCEPQDPPAGIECDEEHLGYWYSDAKLKELLHPDPKPPQYIQMPLACRELIGAQ